MAMIDVDRLKKCVNKELADNIYEIVQAIRYEINK